MKTIIRRSLFIIPLLYTLGFAKPELINQNIIKQHALDKVTELSTELYSKTGVSLVIHLLENTGSNILDYESNLSKKTTAPYVILVFSAQEQKVDIVSSPELEGVVNKNEILNTFIIPILAAQDKNSVETRYSAAVLNGVAEIADRVADSKSVVLVSSIGSESRNFMQGLRGVFYGIVFVAVGMYLYRLYQRRRVS